MIIVSDYVLVSVYVCLCLNGVSAHHISIFIYLKDYITLYRPKGIELILTYKYSLRL